MRSLKVIITNHTTQETLEYPSYKGETATTIRRNAIRNAYYKGFLHRGDEYKVELWAI